jgi:hypothetical protein
MTYSEVRGNAKILVRSYLLLNASCDHSRSSSIIIVVNYFRHCGQFVLVSRTYSSVIHQQGLLVLSSAAPHGTLPRQAQDQE